MGGGGGGGYGNGSRKSSSSCFAMLLNLFRWPCSKNGSTDEACSEEGGYVNGRIYLRDQDGRQYWLTEPGIDRRSTDFIDRFYESRVSDPERRLAP